MRFMFAFGCKKMNAIETKKLSWCLDVIPPNNPDSFFTAKECYPSPFGIIKRTTYFPLFELCFET